ncbi:hypothetical protein BJ508DRAFT_380143 [Ascobolus immersus RN42]|uniref:Uncharacterized protein n=1 Tax=Ascobolus immersus RN42 TaxID=1160509 RepID=A0A3N4HPP2_ASCIM|nr:hypothetical protein BJ508DRAFT_380143 [Ascobolus immersus RN42]
MAGPHVLVLSSSQAPFNTNSKLIPEYKLQWAQICLISATIVVLSRIGFPLKLRKPKLPDPGSRSPQLTAPPPNRQPPAEPHLLLSFPFHASRSPSLSTSTSQSQRTQITTSTHHHISSKLQDKRGRNHEPYLSNIFLISCAYGRPLSETHDNS